MGRMLEGFIAVDGLRMQDRFVMQLPTVTTGAYPLTLGLAMYTLLDL